MIEYRLAAQKDIKELHLVFHEYRSASISLDSLQSPEASRIWIENRMQKNEAVFLIAVNGHGILGFVTMYKGFSSVSLKEYWILNDLYVLESARRQGCAKGLMAKAHTIAVESGAKGVELETAHNNLAAQALYLRMGYVENTLYKNYFWKTVT